MIDMENITTLIRAYKAKIPVTLILNWDYCLAEGTTTDKTLLIDSAWKRAQKLLLTFIVMFQ